MTLTLVRRAIGLAERGIIANAWNNKCAYCKTTDGPFAIDHIVPHSASGTCDVDNLCWACSKCNNQKSDTRLPIFQEGLLLGLAVRRAKGITAKLKAAQTVVKPKVATVAKKPKYESVPRSEMAGGEEYIKRQNGMAVLRKLFYCGLTEESYPSNNNLPEVRKCISQPLDCSFFEQLGLTHREVVDGLASVLLVYRDEGGSGCDSLNFSCTTSAKDGSCVFAFHKSWAELKLFHWRLQNSDHAQFVVAA